MNVAIDDIQAFQDANEEALEAVNEYARRAKKGIPEDRWASTLESRLVAQGIDTQNAILEMQTQVIVELAAELLRKGNDAMRLFADHSKYNQRE